MYKVFPLLFLPRRRASGGTPKLSTRSHSARLPNRARIERTIAAMGLIGVTSISQVTPKYVGKAEAVTPAHEMSAWVNMRVGRIL
jgi:hypothetical protein